MIGYLAVVTLRIQIQFLATEEIPTIRDMVPQRRMREHHHHHNISNSNKRGVVIIHMKRQGGDRGLVCCNSGMDRDPNRNGDRMT